jgi:peptidoglycan/xylan/chitin deacetylase (PgdA/CDA1 family)
MSWSQLRALLACGHKVQSHGWSHVPLTHCTAAELQRELSDSKTLLEDELGQSVDEISIPFGRWNCAVLEQCARAGYRRVFLSNLWFGDPGVDGIEVVGRLMVRRTTTAQWLRALLANGSGLKSLRIRQQIRDLGKRFMSDRVYHQLWCRLAGWEQQSDWD